MTQDICIHCGQPFKRHCNTQKYCGKTDCQNARKAKWRRDELNKNPKFKAEQKQAHQDWKDKRPQDYWKNYRKKTVKKTERNRILQRMRNQRRRRFKVEKKFILAASKNIAKIDSSKLIAKIDVVKPSPHQALNEFWIVPVIAKIDVVRANILIIPDRSVSPKCELQR